MSFSVQNSKVSACLPDLDWEAPDPGLHNFAGQAESEAVNGGQYWKQLGGQNGGSSHEEVITGSDLCHFRDYLPTSTGLYPISRNKLTSLAFLRTPCLQ